MKKIRLVCFLFIVVLSLSSLLFGCYKTNNSDTDQLDTNEYVYVINRKTCKALFKNYPEKISSSLETSSWAKGNYRSASVDEEGNLKLILTRNDIDEWNAHFDSVILNNTEPNKEGADSLNVSDALDKIVISTTKNTFSSSIIKIASIIPCCELRRLLNGEASSELSIAIEVYDTITGELVKKGTVDTENEFNLSTSDWDKNSQDTQEVFSVAEYAKDIYDKLPSYNDFSDDAYEEYDVVFSEIESAKLFSGGRYSEIDNNDPRLYKLLNYILYSFNEKTSSVRMGYIKNDIVEEWYLDDTKMIEIYFNLSNPDVVFDKNDLKTVRKILIRDDSWMLIETPGSEAFGADDYATYQYWPYGSLWDFQTFSDEIMNNNNADTWLGMLINLGF